ncbi:MAG: ferredoxin [Planctomycetes bacterium]|nr:ferredoxin [Planctomycetota bacterium]
MTEPLRTLRIEEGCISCNLCEDLAPRVFEVVAGGECRVRPGALEAVAADDELRAAVLEAAESCPVEVILVDED